MITRVLWALAGLLLCCCLLVEVKRATFNSFCDLFIRFLWYAKEKKGIDTFSSGSAPVTLYEADIGFVKAVFELHRACFISFLLWCFVVLTQWLLFQTITVQYHPQLSHAKSWTCQHVLYKSFSKLQTHRAVCGRKKGPSAVCGVIKTDLILGSLLRTGNGNMKVNYFNCPCVTITKKKIFVFFLYYFYWWKQQQNKKNKNSV